MLQRFKRNSRSQTPSAPSRIQLTEYAHSWVNHIDTKHTRLQEEYTIQLYRVEEVMRVQNKLEIRSKEPIKDLKECLQIAEVWIDEQNCPYWQVGLDTWLFICMALHAQKDINCRYINLYKTQLDQVVEFKIQRPFLERINYKKHSQYYETTHRGSTCSVSYESNLALSKRTGIPSHVLYQYPLKDGNSPPKFEDLGIKTPVEVTYAENDNHIIRIN
ncbi:matrix protein [Bughendera virus]|uniref:Matrix protein n=1 Tax=Bughendera virus TaxID=2740749 RepID=A0A7D4X100_9RHAB|nr:matrix protein [Bughendera virus]QKV49533.1 matrix protein [Bughendera virus]